MTQHQLWAADPHQFGPGKVHIVDDKDESKTFCGRFLAAVPGKKSITGRPTCRICLDAIVRRPEQERQRAEYQKQHEQREIERVEQNAQWQAWYADYLRSPTWRAKRARVIERAGGMCEGCAINRATEVHHVAYAHVGNEFLWELRAICHTCHELVTRLDREAKERRQ